MANPEKSRLIPRNKNELVKSYAVNTLRPYGLPASTARYFFPDTYANAMNQQREKTIQKFSEKGKNPPVLVFSCMDFRTPKPIMDFMNKHLKSYDIETYPGLVGQLKKDSIAAKTVKTALHTALAQHGVEEIYVFGHSNCAGNPVPNSQHQEDVEASALLVEKLAKMYFPEGKITVNRGFLKPNENSEDPDEFEVKLIEPKDRT